MKKSKKKPTGKGPHGGYRDGAGRPAKFKGETTVLTVVVPIELLAKLDSQAEKRGVKRSELIREKLSR